MQSDSTASLVVQQYGITPSLLYKWKGLRSDGGKSAIAAGDETVIVSGVNVLEKKLNSLIKCRDAKRWEPKSFGTRLR